MPQSYPQKIRSKKDQYAEALADFVLANGIAAASLRPMAEAAGTSDRMLLYHFGSKAGVLDAALTRMVERITALMDAAIPPMAQPASSLLAQVEPAMALPPMRQSVAVFLELAALALRGDETAATIGQSIAQHFHDWIQARIDEPDRAMELLIQVEGWNMLTAIGLDVPFPRG